MTTERKRLLHRLYSGTVFVTENTILEGHKLFASQNETTLYGCNDVYDFGGDHLIFRRTKGGSVVTENPIRGDHRKLWKVSEGEPLKFPWKIKTWGGSRKSSYVIRRDHFCEVTFKGDVDVRCRNIHVF